MKYWILKILMLASLVLVVPFLIGRLSVAVLDRTYPAVELPSPAEQCREAGMEPTLECQRALASTPEEMKDLIRSVRRTRAITCVTLVVVGVYYVLLIAAWFIIRRRSRVPETRASQGISETNG